MGPRLLCFVGGAALTAFYVHMGLLGTPFFGSGAFLWASVFACFMLSLALGTGLGDLLCRLAGLLDCRQAGPRLALLGGLGAWLAAWALPQACRAVLAMDPSWELAPFASLGLVAVLPGALIAAILPAELRVRLQQAEGASMSRQALRLMGLIKLGGLAGIALCARPLLQPDQVDVYLSAYILGGLLALIGVAYQGTVGRGVGLGLVGVMIGVSVVHPSEIQTERFAVALEETWKKDQGASGYYLSTTHRTLLSEEQLAKLMKDANAHEKPGVILTCEMLLALGEVTIQGEGLRRTMKLFLDEKGKTFLLPIFEPVESITSDGKGLLHFQIRKKRGQEGIKFELPTKEPGKTVSFWYRSDFTIKLTKTGSLWRMEFGPVTTEHAGVFELNDTKKTPVRLVNVALWIDASLLGIEIEDARDKVFIRAKAQGEVGPIQTKELATVDKERKVKK